MGREKERIFNYRTALVVQWLKLHAFTEGVWVQSLVRKVPHAGWYDKKKKKNLQL